MRVRVVLAAFARLSLRRSRHRSASPPATGDVRTPDVKPPRAGAEAGGRRALRRGSEASHRGDTERPFDIGARHDDERYLIHIIVNALIETDGRDGTVWIEYSGCAKVERRVAGRRVTIGNGVWTDWPDDILGPRAFRHVEHTAELPGDARINPRIRARARHKGANRGGLRARCSTLRSGHPA